MNYNAINYLLQSDNSFRIETNEIFLHSKQIMCGLLFDERFICYVLLTLSEFDSLQTAYKDQVS